MRKNLKWNYYELKRRREKWKCVLRMREASVKRNVFLKTNEEREAVACEAESTVSVERGSSAIKPSWNQAAGRRLSSASGVNIERTISKKTMAAAKTLKTGNVNQPSWLSAGRAAAWRKDGAKMASAASAALKTGVKNSSGEAARQKTGAP